MTPEPTLAEKIAAIRCPLELDGAEEQIRESARMTDEIRAAIARRRVELMRKLR